MKRSKAPSFTNPFHVWTRLACKSGEMMLASAQVVHLRTGRMTAAGATPSARDRREFALMGQEKIQAGVESASALAAQMITMNASLGALVVKHMMTTAEMVMSLAASRTAGQAMARRAKLIRSVTRSAATAAQLSGAAGQLAWRGLKPIHSRARANAKRLGKR